MSSNGSKNVTVVGKPMGTTATLLPTTTVTTSTTAANPITDYHRLDTPVNRTGILNMNQSFSYDSEDSYRSSGNHSQRSYTSYNYMGTSIRDRIYYNTSHQNSSRSVPLMNTTSDAESPSPLSSSPQDQASVSLLTEEDQQRIQYLALRKFHIPGHTFTQDYVYWFCNNHPFICFCYADSRHPLGTIERIINLVSSLAFGLAATCCVFLWFHYHNHPRTNNYGNNINNNNNNIQADDDAFTNSSKEDSFMQFHHVMFTVPYINFNVTTGVVTLLIFSGPLHVLFDLGIYFLQACPPCRVNGCCYHNSNNLDHHYHHHQPDTNTPGKSSYYACMRLLYRQECWLWIGTYVAFCITVAAVSLSIQVTLLRASVIEEQDNNESNISYNIEDYNFMLYYLLEIFVANFVAFPIGTFTMFSGVLGCCGRIPGLGGRPYQVRKHQRQKQQEQRTPPTVELQSIDGTTVKRSNLA